MTLKLRKIQKDDKATLLLVHDASGKSAYIIEALARLAHDIVSGNPRSNIYLEQPPNYLSEVSGGGCSDKDQENKCQADRDGDCFYENCPQKTNRQPTCPLWKYDPEERY